VLASIGEQIWTSDRDERFTASMNTIITGLLHASDPHLRTVRQPPARS
jgi:hypothetical protein